MSALPSGSAGVFGEMVDVEGFDWATVMIDWQHEEAEVFTDIYIFYDPYVQIRISKTETEQHLLGLSSPLPVESEIKNNTLITFIRITLCNGTFHDLILWLKLRLKKVFSSAFL